MLSRSEKGDVAAVHWTAGGEDDAAGHVSSQHNWVGRQNSRKGYVTWIVCVVYPSFLTSAFVSGLSSVSGFGGAPAETIDNLEFKDNYNVNIEAEDPNYSFPSPQTNGTQLWLTHTFAIKLKFFWMSLTWHDEYVPNWHLD